MRPPLTTVGISLTLLVVALGGYVFARTVVDAESASVAELGSQIDVQSKNAHRIASARAALAELAGDEATVQSYFVGAAGVVAFINDLQSRGQALGATVDVESVAATTAREARPALLLALTIKGPFDSVMRTVGSIEYAPYDISITGLTLALDATDVWRASMNLSVGSATSTASPR